LAEIVSLREAVGGLVRDGDSVALEGFTHLIPHAAGHELIRQRRRDLALIRMTPDVIYDQLIGAGCARRLTFSWGGNPGVGSLHRLRDAVENGWPRPLELVEHSHAGMAAAYAAGAANLPFGVLRGYRDTDLAARAQVARISCPFTGEQLAAVPAHRPDVGVIHAQQADRRGNVQLWGIMGVQKEVVLASARSIVTVEEVVDELEPHPGGIVLVYESGTIGAKPSELPLSIGDGELAETADAVVSVPEMFAYWLQGERIDVGFLGAAQIDRHGNLNSTVIGDYERPKVRLPGGGGAPEIATSVRDVFVTLRQTPRAFVERLDFKTSAGDRVRVVVTDLGILEPRDGELTLTHVHPGADAEQAREATGWNLRVADDLAETEPPTEEELAALRSLRTKGSAP
jgi:glutaconate CoA-transferase subunit A